MKNVKELFLKHGLVILAVISIIVLLLPFYEITAVASADMGDFGLDVEIDPVETKKSVSGFNALQNSIFAYALIVGPALLVAMNYVEQLGKYKGLLAIVVPVVCVISMIIIFFSAKGAYIKASGGAVDMEVNVGLGIGAVLAFISYVGSGICGAMTYHNFTLDKAGLEKLKNAGLNLVENAQTAIGNGAQAVSSKFENMNMESQKNKNTESGAEQSLNQNNQTSFAAQKMHKRNVSSTEEVLNLIERLAKMKDAGILTEEEFSEKKKKLLEEI